jgi:L-threonylcarbamoyladenylate synthase
LQWRIKQAARVANEGGVIAYPTEAVYGLGCNPLDAAAVLRLLLLKRRNIDQGLILVAADREQLEDFVDFPGGKSGQAIENSWPGPVTWLVPAQAWVPYWLTGDHDTLAVRVSEHPIVRELCREFAGPLVSTSANIHGHRPARTALQVRRAFGGQIDYLVAGQTGKLAKPTEIRDALSGKIIRAST